MLATGRRLMMKNWTARETGLNRFNVATRESRSMAEAPMAADGNDFTNAAAVEDTIYLRCGCTSCMTAAFGKDYTAFFVDGVGDKAIVPGVDNVALIDTVGGDAATAGSISVGGTIYSSIDDFNDQDFFSVQLVAGKTYAISQLLHVGGNATSGTTSPLLSGVPLVDSFVRLYGADGTTLLAEADGGSTTTPSGLDAKLFYTATTTGTYYINAASFDQDATNGTGGDHVGDYKLDVREVSAANAPLPRFYTQSGSLNPLLDSLDWGSQFARTSRNPDGDNGTRTDNGVPNGGTPLTESTYGITGKNVITFYFARQGDVFLSENPTNPGLETTLQARDMLQWEKDAFYAAFAEYEKVADVKYVEVDSREDAISGIRIVLYPGTPGVGASLLGRMSPPGEQNAGQMEINAGDARWTEEGVSQGGFYFPTLLHELGHGHGMKHPHDNGGGGPLMRGAGPSEDPVEGAIGGAFGDFGLSQGIYTMMSYNDGWSETGGPGGRPAGQGGPRTGGITGREVDGFGHVGTMAALDIAVLQDKYGVNEEWARGDDTYVIGDVNGPGVFYSTIWDGGGNDTISYTGLRNATIDLRAATLKYEEGGGGRVSFALGAWSGFTIANGVTIENATGGSGDDAITGNVAANMLKGMVGQDTLTGLDGADTLLGGAGNDMLLGGAGNDTLYGGAGSDTLNGGEGVDTAQYQDATSNIRVLLNTTAQQTIGTSSGADRLISIENVIGSNFNDVIAGNGGANVLTGVAGNDLLTGGAGDDNLSGGAGVDRLIGGLGADKLHGGAGVDTFEFSRAEGADMIVDLAEEDVIAFKAASFGLSAGALSASQLQMGVAATGAAGVFVFNAATRTLSWDPDGEGAAAAEAVITFGSPVSLAADDFLLI